VDATDGAAERRLAGASAVVFGVVALLAALDVGADLLAGTTLGHVAAEGAIVGLGLGGFLWMLSTYRAVVRRARGLEERTDDLEQRLAATRVEADHWRQEAGDLIAGLGGAIDRQLERWGLSPAEQEVALFLLKGLSHKEVAELRGVSEATVRQQARALYRKAGLSGRHDLAAFFLEDLLGPRTGAGAGS